MKNSEENILTKRFQTTMIGALYEFEESFGYLWGQDKHYEDLTEQQKKFRMRWEDTRNQILNNGNSQLRKCINEIHKNNQDKYVYKLYNKRNNREDI